MESKLFILKTLETQPIHAAGIVFKSALNGISVSKIQYRM